MSQTLGSPGGEGRRPGTLHGPGRILARIRAYLHVNLIHNSASPPPPHPELQAFQTELRLS